MVLRETLIKEVDEVEPQWTPEVPVWEQEISLTESQGGIARQLWYEQFAEYGEIPQDQMQILFTGIGGGAASAENIDGPEAPRHVDLSAEFNEIPRVLFLVASAPTTDNLFELIRLAEEYKRQGVEKVVPFFTALPHERQDHRFNDEDGNQIKEITMLEVVVDILAGTGDVNEELVKTATQMVNEEVARQIGIELSELTSRVTVGFINSVIERIIREKRNIDACMIAQPNLRLMELADQLDFQMTPVDRIDNVLSALEQVNLKETFPKIQALFTGIGGGAANAENAAGVRRYADGSEVPKYVVLKEEFNEVPKVLFLVASARTADNLLGLIGLAEEYKRQGVEKVVAVFTDFPDERQETAMSILAGTGDVNEGLIRDATQMVNDELARIASQMGGEISEFTPGVTINFMNTVIERIMRERRNIDAGAITQPHSKRSIELLARLGFPMIPVDVLPLLMAQSGFEQVPQNLRFVVGPDRGRRDAATRWAYGMRSPLGSADKERARMTDGYPTVKFPTEAIEYMKKHSCVLFAPDDEIRAGGTLFEVAQEVTGTAKEPIAKELRVCVVKLIAAGKAVKRLQHPLITQIITTDAVQPLTDITPIQGKLKVIGLGPEIRALVEYLMSHLVPGDDENWLRDPEETGTLLELDLRVEKYK